MLNKSPYNLIELEDIRYQKKKTKRQIAESLGVTPGYISHYFHGRRWNPSMMQRICNELGVSIRAIENKKSRKERAA